MERSGRLAVARLMAERQAELVVALVAAHSERPSGRLGQAAAVAAMPVLDPQR